MSGTFSFVHSPLSNLPGGSSSSLSQSKTPPPLESALSSSDQYSPTAVDSTGSSPRQFVNPMSLTIPNPFLDPSQGPQDSHLHHHPHHPHHAGSASGGDINANSSSLGWRSEIHPTPIASSTAAPPANVHRPVPARSSGNESFSTQTSSSNSNVNEASNASRAPRSKNSQGKSSDEEPPPGKDRRQKRLERNRESARLSRRRRKQYLEVLETKVTELSDEMDEGRRAHVSKALTAIQLKRQDGFFGPNVARTSAELRMAATFRSQQMQSFCTPPSTKFILWLTLQNDAYFRGGRAASERLSAARIGERMLQNGNDRVTPAQSMWPLFCNEVGLSYDQEERVRGFQKTLLAEKESWVERHTSYASSLTLKSTHEALQATGFRLGHRESAVDGMLTSDQRAKLVNFVTGRRTALQDRMNAQPKVLDGYYQTSDEQHRSGNLYVTNHRLKSILATIPPAVPLLMGVALKKLSRRPSFESLGLVSAEKKENEDMEMDRERSFASSGSLKRCASEMSMDGEERPHVHQISPEEAESAALPHVESVLGHLKPIIPVPTPATPVMVHQMPRAPRTVSSAPVLAQPAPAPPLYAEQLIPTPVASAPHSAVPSAIALQQPEEPASKHQRKSSFLPAGLNVVPEEMWPSDSVAEEFLMSLVEGDWAIGEGVDMEL